MGTFLIIIAIGSLMIIAYYAGYGDGHEQGFSDATGPAVIQKEREN